MSVFKGIPGLKKKLSSSTLSTLYEPYENGFSHWDQLLACAVSSAWMLCETVS